MVNTDQNKFKVCKSCWVDHVENCEECFGFGLKTDLSLINASLAHDWKDEEYIRCGVCGGTPFGIVESNPASLIGEIMGNLIKETYKLSQPRKSLCFKS